MKGKGNLIEAFKLLKGIANPDYSLFSNCLGTLKLEDIHTKYIKIVFAWMLGNFFLVIEWWMHGISCLSMWLMQKL